MKECSQCSQLKNISEFPISKGKCKKCVSVYKKKWRHENKEKIKKDQKKWLADNPEWMSNWQKTNPKCRDQWIEANEERLKVYSL